ncbi:Patatin domain-containing protein [Rhizoctonia solani AG-1 IA]|uniref:Patatin domain-containing protein n=1 Tax=Thanatephorus cucumeris (strain AG1-IA) TaxID=983506 RepID=L8WIT7_THACA|nr:Patatin domain-containing protein [Rhizoctonia solani AG-1 IA]
MSQPKPSGEGLNILSIDGGGARGLSTLIIIEELMKRIQHHEKLESTPSPYQYFDLIAGTGTGAKVAHAGPFSHQIIRETDKGSVLGKKVVQSVRNLNVQDIKAEGFTYGDYTRGNWEPRRANNGEPIHRNTVQNVRKNRWAKFQYNMRAGIPTAFRSYPASVNQGPICAIWEALCATIAHPDLFKSFDIGSPSLKQSFVDAGTTCILCHERWYWPCAHDPSPR